MLIKANMRRRQGRRADGRFLGFWARLNCEHMPVIPACIVRANLDDPRKIPYLLVWKDDRHDGQIMEAVRLTCHADGYSGYVQLKRTDASATVLGIVWRALPRNGGRALFLFCPHCQVPRRFVYGWEWDSFSGWSNRVRKISWRCRSCALLRYSSEGGHLRPTGGFRGLARLGEAGLMLAALGNLPRPESWFPYVFTSIDDPRLDEIVRLSGGAISCRRITWPRRATRTPGD